MNYQERQQQLDEMIANGVAPPRVGGYGGISSFAASSPHTDNIINELMIQIHEMEGQVLLQEPWRIMWRVPGPVIDTVFNAWICSQSLHQYVVNIDMVGGISRNYLTMILPLTNALIANGTIQLARPFNEQEWREECIERLTRRHQNAIDELAN